MDPAGPHPSGFTAVFAVSPRPARSGPLWDNGTAGPVVTGQQAGVQVFSGEDRGGFDTEADLNLVHQGLYPPAQFIDPLRLDRRLWLRAVEPAKQVIEVGQVGAPFDHGL